MLQAPHGSFSAQRLRTWVCQSTLALCERRMSEDFVHEFLASDGRGALPITSARGSRYPQANGYASAIHTTKPFACAILHASHPSHRRCCYHPGTRDTHELGPCKPR